MRKPPVEAITLGVGAGVLGDVHAGPGERQVMLLCMETLRTLAEQVGPLDPGAMGENVVIDGVPAETLIPGAVVEFASGARIEVTGRRRPCAELEGVAPGLLRAAVSDCGVFARVLRSGSVQRGDICRRLAQSPPGAQ